MNNDSKPKPSEKSIWIDAVIEAGYNPDDLHEKTQDLLKKVFDFGFECGSITIENKIRKMLGYQ